MFEKKVIYKKPLHVDQGIFCRGIVKAIIHPTGEIPSISTLDVIEEAVDFLRRNEQQAARDFMGHAQIFCLSRRLFIGE